MSHRDKPWADGTPPSNFRLDITACGHDALRMAFRFFTEKAVGYAVREGKLVFFWSTPERGEEERSGFTRLPFKMGNERAADFAWGWLEQQERKPMRDYDGSLYEDGWRLQSDGHTAWSYAFASISPEWAEYHK